MARESREVWTKRIERLRTSDLTDIEFAAEIGVNVHTLRGWKWKLSGEAKPRLRRVPKVKRKSAPAFVEIAVPTQSAEIVVVISDGVSIRVPAGFDDDTLRRVLDVVRRDV